MEQSGPERRKYRTAAGDICVGTSLSAVLFLIASGMLACPAPSAAQTPGQPIVSATLTAGHSPAAMDLNIQTALAAVALICVTADPARGQTGQDQQAQAGSAQTQQTQPRRLKRMSLQTPSAQGQLARVREYFEYSPESRPIDSSYWDLLHPWSGDPQMRPLYSRETMRQVANQAVSLRRQGVISEESQVQLPTSPLKYQFEMNRTILAGTQDELRARLTVTTAHSSDAGLRIHVSQAEMIGSNEFAYPNLGEVPFSCETIGPTCTFAWRAPSADKQYWGILKLQATLTVEGYPEEFVVAQTFYSSPMVAGKFTGEFHERLDHGSLVIDAGLDVQKHMACFFSGNLHSADNVSPLQHVERRILVDPSLKTISFTFFGKIFRDYADEGAFRLQDLKAQCENLAYPPEWYMDSAAHRAELEEFAKRPPRPREPTKIYFAYNDYSYTTHRYLNSAFSDAQWQSPVKTQALEIYERKARRRRKS